MNRLFGEDFNSGETCTNEQSARDRRAEEDIWDRVAEEMQEAKRPGLWMKAQSQAVGDLKVAEALYMTSLSESIRDEDRIIEENKCKIETLIKAKAEAKIAKKAEEEARKNLNSYRNRRNHAVARLEIPVKGWDLFRSFDVRWKEDIFGYKGRTMSIHNQYTYTKFDSYEEAMRYYKMQFISRELEPLGLSEDK